MSLVRVSTKVPRSVAKRSKPASKCVANGAVRHYWPGPIAAAYAKNRRQDVLQLRANTATALAVHLAGKMPTAAAFAMPPEGDRCLPGRLGRVWGGVRRREPVRGFPCTAAHVHFQPCRWWRAPQDSAALARHLRRGGDGRNGLPPTSAIRRNLTQSIRQ
jgi:hypothetical protein